MHETLLCYFSLWLLLNLFLSWITEYEFHQFLVLLAFDHLDILIFVFLVLSHYYFIQIVLNPIDFKVRQLFLLIIDFLSIPSTIQFWTNDCISTSDLFIDIIKDNRNIVLMVLYLLDISINELSDLLVLAIRFAILHSFIP